MGAHRPAAGGSRPGTEPEKGGLRRRGLSDGQIDLYVGRHQVRGGVPGVPDPAGPNLAGRRIRLVCDNGRFHTTHAVQAWLADHCDQIEVFWLPPYSPSLNLIERLWGHLKRTVLANVLYANLNDLVEAFKTGVRRMTGDRERMGFMFDHDDVTLEIQRQRRRPAA